MFMKQVEDKMNQLVVGTAEESSMLWSPNTFDRYMMIMLHRATTVVATT